MVLIVTDILTPPTDFVFVDSEMPDDTVPPTSQVEFPCEVCGNESGPYAGRGRKPTRCTAHKRANAKGARAPRVTGAPASLAAQAAGVLEQLNGIFAIGCMAVGFNMTASAIAAGNDQFREAAYSALVTDQDLCKLILKGGVKSAKVSLGLAYLSFGMGVAPVATLEYREKKAVREAAKEAANDETRA